MKLSYLKTSLYTVFIASAFVCASQTQAQQYYKWVDAKGSTHYTTTPPPKGAKKLDKIATYGSSVYSAPATETTAPSTAQGSTQTTQQTTQPNSQGTTQNTNQPTETVQPVATNNAANPTR